MDSRLASPRRTGESALTGGRTIRKGRSRSTSLAARTQRQSVPLLDFLDNVLKFAKALLRQENSPLRHDLFLGLRDNLETPQEPAADAVTTAMDQRSESGLYDQMNQDWSASCAAIKMELNRLIMWKFDVAQRKLTPALKEESPIYSVICESILGIGEIFKSRKLFC